MEECTLERNFFVLIVEQGIAVFELTYRNFRKEDDKTIANTMKHWTPE